jgi:hypothetical protein
MNKRATPQHKVDDRAFPVRAQIFVPHGGFGILMTPILEWLDREIGRRSYAWHSGGLVMGRDVVALYVREPEQLAAMLTAWPMLELADGTIGPSYRNAGMDAPPSALHATPGRDK